MRLPGLPSWERLRRESRSCGGRSGGGPRDRAGRSARRRSPLLFNAPWHSGNEGTVIQTDERLQILDDRVAYESMVFSKMRVALALRINQIHRDMNATSLESESRKGLRGHKHTQTLFDAAQDTNTLLVQHGVSQQTHAVRVICSENDLAGQMLLLHLIPQPMEHRQLLRL